MSEGTRPDLPHWLDDTSDGPAAEGASGRRRALLFAAAAVPWVVVTVLLLRPVPVGDATVTAPSRTPSPRARPTAPPVAVPTPSASPRAEAPEATVLAGGGRVVPGLGDAAAVAVIIARAWLTGVPPRLDVPGIAPVTDAYVDHLAVEAIDIPAPGAAVVSVVAVMLEPDGGRYVDATVRRVAVPLHFDAVGARPAGEPWWLPSPDLRMSPLRLGEPVTDVDLLREATSAIEAAGYRRVAVQRAAPTHGWPFQVHLRGVAPGEADRRRHVVWLRPHLGGFVLAGALPSGREVRR